MILVHYSEMLPINGNLIKNEIFELCDDQFKAQRNLSVKQAARKLKSMHKVYHKDNTAIYQQ